MADFRNGQQFGILGADGQPYRRPLVNGDIRNNAEAYRENPPQFWLPAQVASASVFGGPSRTYWHDRFDEALRHSREDAHAFKRDARIKALLNERKRSVMHLKWHIDVPDVNDPDQKLVRDVVTRAIESIHDFQDVKSCLLEALWYGKYAVQWIWGKRWFKGVKTKVPLRWEPLHGDKIGYQWQNDGAPDIPYVLVHGGSVGFLKDRGGKVVPTTMGLGLLLENHWRGRFTIHHHEIEDWDFWEADQALMKHGVGLRSHVYWTEYLRKEIESWITDFMERVGLGVTMWKYEAGNPSALTEVQAAAKAYDRRVNVFVPCWPDGTGKMIGGVERVDPPLAGAEFLRTLIEYFDRQVERLFIGQEGSAKGMSAGLGNEATAEAMQDTKGQITKEDANRFGEGMTGNEWSPSLVNQIVRWTEWPNPKMNQLPARMLFGIESTASEKKTSGLRTLYDMGVTFKASDARDAVGIVAPTAGDELCENVELKAAAEQAKMQTEQAQQPGEQEGQEKAPQQLGSFLEGLKGKGQAKQPEQVESAGGDEEDTTAFAREGEPILYKLQGDQQKSRWMLDPPTHGHRVDTATAKNVRWKNAATGAQVYYPKGHDPNKHGEQQPKSEKGERLNLHSAKVKDPDAQAGQDAFKKLAVLDAAKIGPQDVTALAGELAKMKPGALKAMKEHLEKANINLSSSASDRGRLSNHIVDAVLERTQRLPKSSPQDVESTRKKLAAKGHAAPPVDSKTAPETMRAYFADNFDKVMGKDTATPEKIQEMRADLQKIGVPLPENASWNTMKEATADYMASRATLRGMFAMGAGMAGGGAASAKSAKPEASKTEPEKPAESEAVAAAKARHLEAMKVELENEYGTRLGVLGEGGKKPFHDPKALMSDAELAQARSRPALPMPGVQAGSDLEKRIAPAWDAVSRLWPEVADKITNIRVFTPEEEAQQKFSPTASLNVRDKELVLPRKGVALDPQILWHELTHLEQVERGDFHKSPHRNPDGSLTDHGRLMESEAHQRGNMQAPELIKRFSQGKSAEATAQKSAAVQPPEMEVEKPADQSGPGKPTSDLDDMNKALGRGPAVKEVPAKDNASERAKTQPAVKESPAQASEAAKPSLKEQSTAKEAATAPVSPQVEPPAKKAKQQPKAKKLKGEKLLKVQVGKHLRREGKVNAEGVQTKADETPEEYTTRLEKQNLSPQMLATIAKGIGVELSDRQLGNSRRILNQISEFLSQEENEGGGFEVLGVPTNSRQPNEQPSEKKLAEQRATKDRVLTEKESAGEKPAGGSKVLRALGVKEGDVEDAPKITKQTPEQQAQEEHDLIASKLRGTDDKTRPKLQAKLEEATAEGQKAIHEKLAPFVQEAMGRPVLTRKQASGLPFGDYVVGPDGKIGVVKKGELGVQVRWIADGKTEPLEPMWGKLRPLNYNEKTGATHAAQEVGVEGRVSPERQRDDKGGTSETAGSRGQLPDQAASGGAEGQTQEGVAAPEKQLTTAQLAGKRQRRNKKDRLEHAETLRKDYETKAGEFGADPKYAERVVSELRHEDASHVQTAQRLLKQVEDQLVQQGVDLKKIMNAIKRDEGPEDATSMKGLDAVAQNFASLPEFKGFFKGTEEDPGAPEEKLFEVIKEASYGALKQASDEAIFAQALRRIEGERGRHGEQSLTANDEPISEEGDTLGDAAEVEGGSTDFDPFDAPTETMPSAAQETKPKAEGMAPADLQTLSGAEGSNPRRKAHVDRILKNPQSAEILGQIPKGSKFVGSGREALVWQTPQGSVVRVGDFKERPNIDEVLQPTKTTRYGNVTVEQLPFATNANEETNEAKDAEDELKAKIEAQGWKHKDFGPGTIGKVNGEWKILDPGGMEKVERAEEPVGQKNLLGEGVAPKKTGLFGADPTDTAKNAALSNDKALRELTKVQTTAKKATGKDEWDMGQIRGSQSDRNATNYITHLASGMRIETPLMGSGYVVKGKADEKGVRKKLAAFPTAEEAAKFVESKEGRGESAHYARKQIGVRKKIVRDQKTGFILEIIETPCYEDEV